MSTNPSSPATQDHEPGARGYRVPFVGTQIRAPQMSHMPRMPHVSMPSRRAVGGTVGAARSHLPSPAQAAFFGGLAVMAAIQLIEWPVAVAVGVGTALAGRGGRDESRERAADRDREEAAKAEQAASAEQAAKAERAATPAQRVRRGTSAGRISGN